MSTILKARIDRLTDKLAEVGLSGGNMNTTLSKFAEDEDLSGNEIRRIAENANRKVQLGLYKKASDKRFKFDLADGVGIAKKAAKAEAESKTSAYQTRLDAIDESDSSPFEAPARSKLSSLSIFSSSVKVASNEKDLVELKVKLGEAKAKLEAINIEAKQAEVSGLATAHKANDQFVQSAINLITHGVTLPSLYEAIIAGCEDVKQTDDLAKLLINGLKKRGVANYKMGFRHTGDPAALEKLTTEDLINLCKRQSQYQEPRGLTMKDVKTAGAYTETSGPLTPQYNPAPLRPDDALDILKNRPSQNGQFAVPQAYLDDAENIPKSGLRVYNTDDQFIINIKDLVGAQDRINKSHSAQEYIGLKLKQIEEAMRKLKTAEISPATTKTIGELIGIEKDAFLMPLLRGAGSMISRAVSPMAGAVAKSAPMQSIGTLGKGVTKTYQNVVPAKARGVINKTVEVATHPGTQVALAGGQFLKDS
jgi:hypothetical protein